jgi:hypothetical protein
MSERTTSGREVARQLGVSHTAIQKAERICRITREPYGAWDPAHVRREMAATRFLAARPSLCSVTLRLSAGSCWPASR